MCPLAAEWVRQQLFQFDSRSKAVRPLCTCLRSDCVHVRYNAVLMTGEMPISLNPGVLP